MLDRTGWWDVRKGRVRDKLTGGSMLSRGESVSRGGACYQEGGEN